MLSHRHSAAEAEENLFWLEMHNEGSFLTGCYFHGRCPSSFIFN